MFSHTSTEWAPWYVIPADRKWFARIGAGAVIAHALIDIDPQYPTLGDDALRDLEAAKTQLEVGSTRRGGSGSVRSSRRRERDRSGQSPRRRAERWRPNSWPPSTTAPPARAAFSSMSNGAPDRDRRSAAQTMHYPRPGWVELDMEEVWHRTQECIHEALRSAGAAPADVAGIGITNERESVVLWDRRTGRPVARSITWQDTRTAAAADALAADGGIHRFQRSHRPADLDVLLRPEARLAARPGPGQAGGGRAAGTSCSAHRTPGSSGTSPAVRTAGCTRRTRRTQAAPS